MSEEEKEYQDIGSVESGVVWRGKDRKALTEYLTARD